jgi:hypothetical protein
MPEYPCDAPPVPETRTSVRHGAHALRLDARLASQLPAPNGGIRAARPNMPMARSVLETRAR